MSNKLYRALKSDEIKVLLNNNNHSENWDSFLVSGNFNPSLIRNNYFFGNILLGDLTPEVINFANLKLPVGIYNSFLDTVTIGSQVAIHSAKFIGNYSIGDKTLIFNIGDLTCNENSNFGSGNWIEVANENGGRKILSFEGIREADAFLWSKFRDDKKLIMKLESYTNNTIHPETMGIIGNNCVIKNAKSIKDCKLFPFSIINGSSYLDNLTVQSSFDEPSKIGNETEISNSIIGFGNQINSGSKCVNIISGRNVAIKLGARVLNTFVGANSTIACCEVLNNLLFPFHEQHHNNSFLIASTVMGQSNIAAGATIGSNHNSRAADGEILAKRGFWPGLNTSFKHNSVFASYSIIAKAAYQMELNITLPFSLVSKDENGRVQIFPAFWLRYNMYALARNAWKFKNRDKRKVKDQHIEYNYLAPDTVSEILSAIEILENAVTSASGKNTEVNEYDFEKIEDLDNIYLEKVIPKHEVLIIKPLQAIWLFKNMISYNAANEILEFLSQNDWPKLEIILQNLTPPQPWFNFGGQLIDETNTLKLIADIKTNKINSWDAIHQRYEDLWKNYEDDKLKSALTCWLKKENKTSLGKEDIITLLTHAVKVNDAMRMWAWESRSKDYTNPFRKMNYRNEEEMNAIIGDMKDNIFIKIMEQESEDFKNRVNSTIIQFGEGKLNGKTQKSS